MLRLVQKRGCSCSKSLCGRQGSRGLLQAEALGSTVSVAQALLLLLLGSVFSSVCAPSNQSSLASSVGTSWAASPIAAGRFGLKRCAIRFLAFSCTP